MPVTLPENIGVEFTRLALWNHRIERILGEEEEIPVNQLHCLIALYLKEPSSARELADYLGVRDTSLSKLLKSLESCGAVQRCRDSADRRVERVSLTHSGECIAERTLTRAAAIGNQFLAELPQERREQFMRCLGVITSSNLSFVAREISGGDGQEVQTLR
jgi:DNA-binding MarR family transcriptional regulator